MKDDKRYVIEDAEAGNAITETDTFEEAKKIIEGYEREDKAEGNYEEGFYAIRDTHDESIDSVTIIPSA